MRASSQGLRLRFEGCGGDEAWPQSVAASAEVVDAFWDMDQRIGSGGIDDGTTATILLVARGGVDSLPQVGGATAMPCW